MMSNSVDNNILSSKEIINSIPSHLEWLKYEAPGFALHGDQIKILWTPDEFYSAIMKGCREANHQIALAALYIGKGALEEKMIKVLDDRMTERGKELKVTFLLDAVRGARDESVNTLVPLIRKHPTCQVCLFHNPVLRGLLLRLLPAKANEAIGVQHIKLYVFDDTVLISGANLTTEYFTSRQDRYMLISNCQPLAAFVVGLIEKLCLISLRLSEDNSLVAQTPDCHPYLSPHEAYIKFARKIVWDYYKLAQRQKDKNTRPGDDTWIFPFLQLPPLYIQQDSCFTQKLLESAGKNTVVHLYSPYFNLPEKYIVSLLQKCRATFNILIAHPTASNFYGARGFSGQIPTLYRVLAKSFLHRVENTGQTDRIFIKEFSCPKGSFHCKGVWLTESGDDSPYLTLIGSSNFNYRSVDRDLECQMVVLTRNEGLRKRLREEHERLHKHGIPFTQEIFVRPERRPKLWQHLFLWLFKGYF